MSALFEVKFSLLGEDRDYGKKTPESQKHIETTNFNDETTKDLCEELFQLHLSSEEIIL